VHDLERMCTAGVVDELILNQKTAAMKSSFTVQLDKNIVHIVHRDDHNNVELFEGALCSRNETNTSPGSVAKRLECDGIINDQFIAGSFSERKFVQQYLSDLSFWTAGATENVELENAATQ